MVLCDRIIYTSAQTKDVRGYQIVAYSSGIKEEKEEIEKHSLPYRTIPPDFRFNSFIRFYRFSNGRIGMTKLVNTGEDEFGRPNRIYAYTIVVDETTFYELGSNPFIVESLKVDETLRGKIDKINLDPSPLELREANKNLMELILKLMEISIEKNKTILIVDSIEDGEILLKNLLTLFPPKVRMDLSFSTFSLLASMFASCAAAASVSTIIASTAGSADRTGTISTWGSSARIGTNSTWGSSIVSTTSVSAATMASGTVVLTGSVDRAGTNSTWGSSTTSTFFVSAATMGLVAVASDDSTD